MRFLQLDTRYDLPLTVDPFPVVNMANLALSVRMEGRALEGMAIPWTIAVSSVAVSYS